jgi:hypothetical protein
MKSLSLDEITVVSNAHSRNRLYSPSIACKIDIDLGDHDTEQKDIEHSANKHWPMASYHANSICYVWKGTDKAYLVSAGPGMVCGKEGCFFVVVLPPFISVCIVVRSRLPRWSEIASSHHAFTKCSLPSPKLSEGMSLGVKK